MSAATSHADIDAAVDTLMRYLTVVFGRQA
jgi:hypothetical protein